MSTIKFYLNLFSELQLQIENYSASKHQLNDVLKNIGTLSYAISRENKNSICNFFRNVCAHDEVMYSFSLNKVGQTAIFKISGLPNK